MFLKTKIKKNLKSSEKLIHLYKLILVVVVTALILILISSLNGCITIKINIQKGSGNLIEKEFAVKSFERLDFTGRGKIIISQGDVESLIVKSEDNVIENIDVDNSGNRLLIGFKRGIFNVVPTKDIIFYLTVKNLEKINLSGVGSIEAPDLNLKQLLISSSGAGNIKINIVAEALEIDISGAGKITASGKVKTQKLNISGVGSYIADELVSNDCQINISGAGKAVVNVIQTLDIKLSGLGKVEYFGNPTVIQNILGAGGSIKRID